MTARTAAALCIANRWIAAAALLLTAAALVHLSESRPLLAALLVAGGVQTCLAFRIEFDRVLFESVAAGAASFEELGITAPEQRARRLRLLVICSAFVLAVQVALAVGAVLNLG